MVGRLAHVYSQIGVQDRHLFYFYNEVVGGTGGGSRVLGVVYWHVFSSYKVLVGEPANGYKLVAVIHWHLF